MIGIAIGMIGYFRFKRWLQEPESRMLAA